MLLIAMALFSLLQWSELKVIIQDGGLEKLGRSTDEQQKYRKFRDELTTEWKSLSDYVLVTKLGITEIQSDCRRKAADRSQITGSHSVVLRNDFPYNFASNVEHHVLWKLGSSISKDDIDQAVCQLVRDRNATDFAFYTNPVGLKSILDIEHCHILVKVEAS